MAVFLKSKGSAASYLLKEYVWIALMEESGVYVCACVHAVGGGVRLHQESFF